MFKYSASVIDTYQEALDRLLRKKLLLDDARPLPYGVISRLREDLSLEWTHHSTSIEGNTLSLNETVVVLKEGMTIGGKSMREHFEIHNHHKAIKLLYKIIARREPFSVADILDIHRVVLNNIEDHSAGRIRSGGVRIIGANFTPPSARKASDLLDDLMGYIHDNPHEYSDILLATYLHHKLVWIHPFTDGNGRTARLAMNLLLMTAGYPPAIILRQDRKKYFEALNRANKGSYDKLTLLMIQAVERSLNIYLNSIDDEDEYMPISQLVEEEALPYGQEYISLLARRGHIDAYKEGRNWLTNKRALEAYISKKKSS